MVPSKALLSLILITLTAVDANPISRRTGKASLGFTTKFKRGETLNIVEKDRARARAINQAGQLGKRSGSSFSVTNTGFSYTADIGIGSPSNEYTVIIDTASANTWVGADKSYVKTATSQDTGNAVSLPSYVSGGFSGEEWYDTVTLSSGLVISQQSIGVANSTNNFNPGFKADGVLGVGPTILSRGTVSNTDTVPTVLDNLLSQGKIPEEVLGIYFTPVSATGGGELTFGGYDESATVGPVVYAPLTTTSPASNFWGIDMSISYGDTSILSQSPGVLDSGGSLILMASDAFQKYQSLTGGTMDSATGLLSITPTQYANLLSLQFTIGDVPFDLTPNGQIWPRSLNTALGGSSGAIYLVVGEISSSFGSGLEFLLGYTFLERFYSVYDASNQRVGLAYTKYTFSESN